MWLAVIQGMRRHAVQLDAGLKLILILFGYFDSPRHALAMQRSCREVEKVSYIVTCMSHNAYHCSELLWSGQAAPKTWATGRFVAPPSPSLPCFPSTPSPTPQGLWIC